MFEPHYRHIGGKRVLIFSDLHLGAAHCNVKAALKILKRERFDILIILGDLFDGGKLERVKGRHWAVLSRLRKLTKKQEIIYITGNHCFLPAKFMSQLLGLDCHDNYALASGTGDAMTKAFLIHGDGYDLWCANHKWSTRLGTWAKHMLDTTDRLRFPRSHSLGKLAAKLDRWSNLATTVRFVALQHAKLLKADWMICGHTHTPEITPPQLGQDDPGYANSGGLVENLDSYLILENGHLSLHYAKDLKRPTLPELLDEVDESDATDTSNCACLI